MTAELAEQAAQYGLAVLVLVIVLGLLIRGSLRLEREYLDMRADRDMWRRIAIEGNTVTSQAVEVAELAVGKH